MTAWRSMPWWRSATRRRTRTTAATEASRRTGPAMRIERIETRRYVVPLDPPFVAAWDPVPRDRIEETVTIVHSGDGLCGYASGAPLPDAESLERLLKGVDPLRTEVVRRICE